MKKYINQAGKLYNGYCVRLNGEVVVNPTEEQILAAGFVEYIEPEVTQEELLNKAKGQKIAAIVSYDSSDAVNSFNINGQSMWLTPVQRQTLLTQINAHETMGRTEMTKYFNGVQFTFSLEQWKQMLAALEVYAGDALNATEAHKVAINALSTIEDVENYDYTTGYPEKLNF